MKLTQEDLIREVKLQLDQSGVNISASVIRMIVDTEHEVIRNNLIGDNTIEIKGCFSARLKQRGYRDPGGRGRMQTIKAEAFVDGELKELMMMKKGISNQD